VDLGRPKHLNRAVSGRSASKIFYVETLATTIRAISGLVGTPPVCLTWPLTKSGTVRSTFGLRAQAQRSSQPFFRVDQRSVQAPRAPSRTASRRSAALVRSRVFFSRVVPGTNRKPFAYRPDSKSSSQENPPTRRLPQRDPESLANRRLVIAMFQFLSHFSSKPTHDAASAAHIRGQHPR
jgi:hypothetical protein